MNLPRLLMSSLSGFVLMGSPMSAAQAASAALPVSIPLTPKRWQTSGKVEFIPTEGFPLGRLKVADGSAIARDLKFADGTIEYDTKLLDDSFAAIRFRRTDPDKAEIFYLRPDADCPAANDCVQYVPRVHGVWPWEMYPEYQASAPLSVGHWNHVKLVVSGRRMNVYINGATSPTLVVGRLEGDALEGGLELAGPAEFANLKVTAGETSGLSPLPSADPTARDQRLIRSWEVSMPQGLPAGVSPGSIQIPTDEAMWRKIPVERHGLVNLSRLYGSPTDEATTAIAWLRTTIRSDRVQTKHVCIGFLHEARVYVNGKPVFSKDNLYYPASARMAPDGRLSLENGSFALPLRKGDNQIAVALGNTLAVGHMHYGWGLELRLDDLSGIERPTRLNPRGSP